MAQRRRHHPDWNCSRCSFKNFGSRARCKNCSHGTRPNNNNQNNNRNNNNFGQKKGDWNCSKCNFSNFKSRNVCKNCGAAKVEQSLFNQSIAAVNALAAVPKILNNFVQNIGVSNVSSSSSSNNIRKSKELLQRSGDWKCNKCAFVNYQDRMECEKCKTSKVESNEKWFKTQFISDIEKMDEQNTKTTKGGNKRNKNKNKNNDYNDKPKKGRRGSRGKGRGSGKQKEKKKDWNCSQCNYENRPSRKQCRQCSAPKPEQQPQPQPQQEAEPGQQPKVEEKEEIKNDSKMFDISEKVEFAK
eukprot:148809_1